MKHLYSVCLVLLALAACGQNGSTPEKPDNPKTYSVVGVWKNGNKVVSFSADNFYSAYLGNDFIDGGTYTVTDNTITCSNTYFNRTSVYQLSKLDDNSLKGTFSSTDVNGKKVSQSIDLSKTDKTPTPSMHTFAGKTVTESSILGSTSFTTTYTFSTNCSGTKSANKSPMSKYPIRFFYVYIGDIVYFQLFYVNEYETPSIGGWTTFEPGEVRAYQASFSSNGYVEFLNPPSGTL